MKPDLKRHRWACNLTQQQVAEHVGKSRSMIAEYEAGTSMPAPDVLWKLARLYGVSVDALYSDSLEAGPQGPPAAEAIHA